MGECAVAFTPAIEVTEVPVIDLSDLNSPDSLNRIASEIGSACEKWGVFQVINHGVPSEMQEKFEQVMKKFFAQPAEEKRKLRKDIDEEIPYDYGYEAFTEDFEDWKEMFDFPVEKGTVMAAASTDPNNKKPVRELLPQWPQYPPEFREVCEEYGEEMEKLSYKLMELIALSLGLPRQRFTGFFKDHCNMGRIIHCPPCPTPQLALGTHEHTDVGALTILAQDEVGGLQAKRNSDGEWIKVKYIPNAYVINVGDMLEVWSNKKYVSLVHRAMVNSEKQRYSIPFFFNPATYVVVEPMEELINEENPANYRALDWGKYYSSRKYKNIKNHDMDILRLRHFKVFE